MKDNQKYSKIAKQYLENMSKKDNLKYTLICFGNFDDMENLFDLFGGDRESKKVLTNQGLHAYIRYKYQFVLNKLDKESKELNSLFERIDLLLNEQKERIE